MLKTSTLRPGLLVSLKTSIRGNVKYDATVLEGEHFTADGAMEKRWETTKHIADPAEHERAVKARSKAAATVRGVCSHSAFGLLCPENRTAKLDEAIAEARRIADEF